MQKFVIRYVFASSKSKPYSMSLVFVSTTDVRLFVDGNPALLPLTRNNDL